jgi:poly(hydroxyalkanoate) granule-associated protein
MTTTVIEVEQIEEKEANIVQETLRKSMLIGLGAFGLVQDNVVEMMDKLVERGEKVSKERRAQFEEMFEGRKKEAQKASKTAEKRLEKRLENVLHTLNIPTRDDIRSLNTKVTALSKKVDELKKSPAQKVEKPLAQ